MVLTLSLKYFGSGTAFILISGLQKLVVNSSAFGTFSLHCVTGKHLLSPAVELNMGSRQ
jgi:hypothetical protein